MSATVIDWSFDHTIYPMHVRFDSFTYRGKKLSGYCNPEWIEWKKQFIPMQNKLYNEEYEGKFPDPCIPRDAFPDMVVGMSAGNAELLLKYLVVK